MSAPTREHEYSALRKNDETVYDYIETTVSNLIRNNARKAVVPEFCLARSQLPSCLGNSNNVHVFKAGNV